MREWKVRSCYSPVVYRVPTDWRPFLLGLKRDGRLAIFNRTFERCMGLCLTDQTRWLSSLNKTFSGLALDDRPSERQAKACCGL